MPTVEQVEAQLEALREDVNVGRRTIYGKIDEVHDKIGLIAREVHGITVQATEREKRHDERHEEIRAELRDARIAAAQFQREQSEALRGPPPKAAVSALEAINQVDNRILLTLVVIVGLVTGTVTAPLLERMMLVKAITDPPPPVAGSAP